MTNMPGIHTYKRCCWCSKKYGFVALKQSIKARLPAVVGHPTFSANRLVKRRLRDSGFTAQ